MCNGSFIDLLRIVKRYYHFRCSSTGHWLDKVVHQFHATHNKNSEGLKHRTCMTLPGIRQLISQTQIGTGDTIPFYNIS